MILKDGMALSPFVIMKTKICTKCRTEYPATLEYFGPHKLMKNGLRSRCRKCRREDDKEYRQTEKRKAYQREYGKEYHKKYMIAYRRTFRGRLQKVFSMFNCRCTNSKIHNYSRYGGRGIKNKFRNLDNFRSYVVNDLGITDINQIKNKEIHRINNNRHYEKGNIEFLTPKEHKQAHIADC